MSETTTTTVNPVRYEECGPMLLAGMGRELTFDEMGDIPALWQQFGPRIGSIPGQVGTVAYGVNYAPASGDQGEFGYMAAVEVADVAAVPDDLTTFAIPANRYAVFAHEAHVTRFPETIHAIMSEWLPRSGYRIPHTGSASLTFLERYTEEFNPETGFGGTEVWLPIERG